MAVGQGEVLGGVNRDETRGTRHEQEGTGSALLQAALARENLRRALKRVRANRGSAGVDGLDIEQTMRKLLTEWPVIREQLLRGT
jgi:RNA-directed DNA polymerase